VLGCEWLVVSKDPVRKVNVIGFDAEHARKKGLSVFTADTIANATEQRSNVITQLNRDYEVKESFAEAGDPNRNPVESKAIKWLKGAGERLLNQRGLRTSFGSGRINTLLW
jgi:hypothetical protein